MASIVAADAAARIGEQQRFQLLVEAVTDYAIYLLDPQGHIWTWNAGAERLKGFAADEVLGRHFSMFYTEPDRASDKPRRALDVALRAGRYEDEGWHLRKDGSRFWALVVIDAVRDGRGRLVGFAKVTRDMTEQREAQRKLEDAREQLFQAQKMEAIGQLTGGVAHDFNNLLTVILGGLDLAEGLVGEDAKLKRLLANMRQAAKRGESLTRQLLAFSRRQPLRPERIDLPRRLGAMCDFLSHSLRGDITIATDFPSDLWPVEVDPNQFELAFLNVGLNARDAMPDGGTLHVVARNVERAPEHSALEGTFVALELRDTGVGMSEEVRARAVEPFFTTKDVAGGSGLGLSQAFGFAKQSGGTLTLASEVGRGTTVTFFLPTAVSRSLPQPHEASAEPMPSPSGANILLVEDEPGVAELAVGLLEGAGFTVTVAENAKAALDVLHGGAPIDLLFSDIMMPGGMNGAELARAVHREFPHVFILLATGYADAAADRIAREFPLITKPYGRTALLDKLATILGEAD